MTIYLLSVKYYITYFIIVIWVIVSIRRLILHVCACYSCVLNFILHMTIYISLLSVILIKLEQRLLVFFSTMG